ncbi:hypothetical protein [Paractinoplanes rishiriensis]|uniref:Secreted protein n=1 Tax=Paractinoplanes rishiriensis TaxID=1050105 RepID=A0A919JY25_9ACTN|nr:hypothetical protein [Actinoplanes rishiriensis]GIE95605.1 hypothetical protein Ari01nite_30700 [Actinoplanes rishiriensis]
MRRLLTSAVLAMALVVGAAGPAPAAPPGPDGAPVAGWSVVDGRLTWTSGKPVPLADAAVEFWSGDRRLGRAKPHPDSRTFSLDLASTAGLDNLGDLEVRAGGKRLDRAEPPRTTSRKQAVPTPPAPQPAHGADPGKPGPYRTVTGEYDLPGVKLPDFGVPVEMRGVVVAPRGAPGARPLALFLHGRHLLCYRGMDEEVPQEWPCPAGTDPLPSHRGYIQAQQLLASQGYVTVSISANGINGQDYAVEDGGAQARSSLVRLHLAKWAEWAGAGRAGAPGIARSAPRADLSKVFLMGHSRGGEGVSRAAMDSLTPPPADRDGYRGPVRWTIRGMLLIGPTIFGQNPVPDVPSATILPGCDGDVFDLQGQLFVDETRGVSRGRALHSALYFVGANHNFFNTEWTPGQSVAPSWDDFGSTEPDPVCSPGTPTRLTAAQQQTAGATYIAAAARLFVGGDDRIRPLFDGSGVRAPSAGPARVLSHALGGNRTPVLAPGPSTKVSAGARICEQITDDAAKSCIDPQDMNSRLAHFAQMYPIVPEPGRYAAELSWSAAGRPIRLAPARPVSVAGSRELALRVIVPPNTTGTRFGVTVVGADGRRAALGDVRIDGLPGTEWTTSYWGQEVRVPLTGAPGRVAAVEFVPRSGSGRAWVLDAWGWSPGTPDPAPVALPRLDIGKVQPVEGDTGSATYEVPVSVTGSGGGTLRLFLTDNVSWVTRSWVATVRPGQRTIEVPVEVTGDTIYGEGEGQQLTAKAESGFVVGDYVGGLDVVNDDPRPGVSVAATSVRVAEGAQLTWEVTLSAPTETVYFVVTEPRAPASGVELSTLDVDRAWFEQNAWQSADPERPLSATWLVPYLGFAPGETTNPFTIPTVTDDRTEPDELVELHAIDESGLPVLTGTVTGG